MNIAICRICKIYTKDMAINCLLGNFIMMQHVRWQLNLKNILFFLGVFLFVTGVSRKHKCACSASRVTLICIIHDALMASACSSLRHAAANIMMWFSTHVRELINETSHSAQNQDNDTLSKSKSHQKRANEQSAWSSSVRIKASALVRPQISGANKWIINLGGDRRSTKQETRDGSRCRCCLYSLAARAAIPFWLLLRGEESGGSRESHQNHRHRVYR